MTRVLAIGVVVAVVFASLGGASVVGAAGTGGVFDAATDDAQNETGSVAPGERLAGVVGVQRVAVDSEVASRTFETRLGNATSDRAKAGVVASRIGALEARLDALRDRKRNLTQARENGSLAPGSYRARMAVLAAEANALERLANRTATAARPIPADALAARGANASAVRRLGTRASNLTGPATAAVAHRIAGQGVGADMAPDDRPGPRGPGNRAGATTDPGPASTPDRSDTTAPGQSNETAPGTPDRRPTATAPDGRDTLSSPESGGSIGESTTRTARDRADPPEPRHLNGGDVITTTDVR